MHPLVLITSLTASVLTSALASQPIVPLAVEYFNSAEEINDANVCEIVAVLTNTGPPQRVTITAFAGYDQGEGELVVGLVVGAANELSSGELEGLNVRSAALISDSFSSADEFDYEVTSDGDGLFLAGTSDAEVAINFLRSMADGDYYFSLSADDSETHDWIYEVKSAPSDVLQHFARCLEHVSPSAISHRAHHSYFSGNKRVHRAMFVDDLTSASVGVTGF